MNPVAQEIQAFARLKGLNAAGWSDALIQQLVDAGLVHNPQDLYRITLEQLAGLELLNLESAQRLLAALEVNS